MLRFLYHAIPLLSSFSLAHLQTAQQRAGSFGHEGQASGRALSSHSTSLNGPCAPEVIGYGPQPDIDTPQEFLNYTKLFATARIAKTPLGYTLVGQALNGSVYGKVFHGFEYLAEFDPQLCAKKCSAIEDCSSFNIYYERDPTVDPDYEGGCPDPPSTTNIKCVLWGQSINTDIALNWGETRCDFKVVIAGSNYYIKQSARTDLTSLGFFGPRGDVKAGSIFPHTEMFEPTDDYLTFLNLSREFYPTDTEGPGYNPEVCARECNALSEYNSQHRVNEFPYINGAYPVCNMFTIFEISLISDNNPLAFVCFFYSASWDSLYATETSGFDREGRHMHSTLVKLYQRLDYHDPPLCALKSCKGAQYYSGGNCSGWGPNYCQHRNGSSNWRNDTGMAHLYY